jgi:hypothetical protein
MFYSKNNFLFIEEIYNHLLEIKNELDDAKLNSNIVLDFFTSTPQVSFSEQMGYWAKETGVMPEQLGYKEEDVAIIALPLYKRNFEINEYDVKELFPKLIELLNKIPAINFAAFFRLPPSAKVLEHAHIQNNLIVHFCLTNTSGDSNIFCNDKRKKMNQFGDYCIFDYSNRHYSINNSETDRVNLVIDFAYDYERNTLIVDENQESIISKIL